MKVFLTGATGAIGPATARALVAGGHEVRAVARSDEKAALVKQLGVEPVTVDLFDAEAVRAAVAGSEGVLHLATNVPALNRAARKKNWSMHNALRTTATEHLVSAARASGVQVFVKESITFTYVGRGAEWIDEDAAVDDSIDLLRPTLEGERIALDFAGEDRSAVVLRFGLFYGPHARTTDEMLRMARLRMSPTAGSGDAYMSSVHVDDVANAVVASLTAPSGVYNVCDDEPLTRRDYLDAFSAAFGLGRLMIAPSWVMRTLAGNAARLFTASQRCSNAKFRRATGWSPLHPNARDGWADAALVRTKEATDA